MDLVIVSVFLYTLVYAPCQIGALEWTDSQPNGAQLEVCEGNTTTFPWGLHLAPGERVGNVSRQQTPSGTFLPSISYDNGLFSLIVPIRVESGDYSCQVDSQAPVLVCVGHKHLLRHQPTVRVDAMLTRLIFLESRNTQLTTRVTELIAQKAVMSARDTKLTVRNTELTTRNIELTARNTELTARNIELTAHNTALDAHITELTALNTRLTARNTELTARKTEMTARNIELTACNTELTDYNTELTACNTELTDNNTELTACNTELTDNNTELTARNTELTDPITKQAAGFIEFTSRDIALTAHNTGVPAPNTRLTALNTLLTADDANRAYTELTAHVEKLKQLTLLFQFYSCSNEPQPLLYSFSGVRTLVIGQKFVQAYCDQDTDHGGWTVIQRRQNGQVDFYRGWDEYVKGFGDPSNEYWLGLENIHQLTSRANYTLRVDLWNRDGTMVYAQYDRFSLGGSSDNYTLHLSGYDGTAGDSMLDTGDCGIVANNKPFSTFDRDNDLDPANCAFYFGGGWWHDRCQISNLNGQYSADGKVSGKGLNWYRYRNDYRSFVRTEMKIRLGEMN